jgi:hypothetical protein
MEEALQKQGFVKKRLPWHVRALSKDVTGIITYNILSHKPSVTLDAFVSVNSETLERHVSEFSGEKFKLVSTMSLCSNVKTFLPEVPLEMYQFDCEKDLARLEGQTQEIIRATSPFLSKNNSLEAICETYLSKGIGYNYFSIERVPVALWLLGETEEAKKFVKAEKIRQEMKYGSLSEDRAKFYARLEAAMSLGRPGA